MQGGSRQSQRSRQSNKSQPSKANELAHADSEKNSQPDENDLNTLANFGKQFNSFTKAGFLEGSKKVQFGNRGSTADGSRFDDSSISMSQELLSGRREKEDLKNRVKKNQTLEEKEAKHDLMTALRVAMRKMLNEAIELTIKNMKDNKKEMEKVAKAKKSKTQKKYLETIEKQRQVMAKHAAASNDGSSSLNTNTFRGRRMSGLPFLNFNQNRDRSGSIKSPDVPLNQSFDQNSPEQPTDYMNIQQNLHHVPVSHFNSTQQLGSFAARRSINFGNRRASTPLDEVVDRESEEVDSLLDEGLL